MDMIKSNAADTPELEQVNTFQKVRSFASVLLLLSSCFVFCICFLVGIVCVSAFSVLVGTLRGPSKHRDIVSGMWSGRPDLVLFVSFPNLIYYCFLCVFCPAFSCLLSPVFFPCLFLCMSSVFSVCLFSLFSIFLFVFCRICLLCLFVFSVFCLLCLCSCFSFSFSHQVGVRIQSSQKLHNVLEPVQRQVLLAESAPDSD